MAEADLDAVSRKIHKHINKILMDAEKKRRDQFMDRAAKGEEGRQGGR
jgi:hypothetical protein